VRTIEDAKDALKKELRARQVVAIRQQSVLSEDQKALREQLEADRRERAATGPVTKGSVAQALPVFGQSQPSTGRDAGFE
jgi:hypothetical protein